VGGVASSLIVEITSLAPLLVLFFLRHLAAVTFTYALILFLLLSWHVDHLVRYGVHFFKFDPHAVLLLLFGGISIAIILLWATMRLWSLSDTHKSPAGRHHDSDRPLAKP
jgi:type VI protein secretion system component VasK